MNDLNDLNSARRRQYEQAERTQRLEEYRQSKISILYAGDYLYAKGHVDKAEMLHEASGQYGLDGYTEADVEHTYLRSVPSSHYSDYDFMLYRSRPGRGAFPVTLIDRDR